LFLGNVVWNLAGMTAPMAVGLFAIPYILRRFGTDRFGLLTIIWMGVGYFTLFDLGFGRALTRIVAEKSGRAGEAELRAEVWTGLWLVLALGVLGALAILVSARLLVVGVLNVPAGLHAEGIDSFRLLGAALPFIVGSSALIGVLEAHQAFAGIAAIRIPLGVMTFLAPVVSLQFTNSLVAATVILVLVRIVAFVLFFRLAAGFSTAVRRPVAIDWAYVGPLFSFGGWLTVSSLVGPVMLYTDRFLIGSLLNLSSVSLYATPYEVLARLQVIPQALLGVLFPAFAHAHSSNSGKLAGFYSRAGDVLMVTMFPLFAVLFIFAPELLNAWLGPEFGRSSSTAARWLCVGWLNVLVARTNSTVLQATGRPDLLAKTHLGELLPYLALLWWLTVRFGIAGASIAWTLRGVIDACLLAYLAARSIPAIRRRAMRSLADLAAIWVIFAMLAEIDATGLKLVAAALISGGCAVLWVRLARRFSDTTVSQE
jgi:O-antigen/teichoic acid export membrane protein